MRSSLDEVDWGREEEKEVHKVEQIGEENGGKARRIKKTVNNCTTTALQQGLHFPMFVTHRDI